MLTDIELDELTCQIQYINRMWDERGIIIDAATLQSLTQPVRFARGGAKAPINPTLQIFARDFGTQTGKDLFIDIAVALAAWSSAHPHSIKFPMGLIKGLNEDFIDVNNVRYIFKYDVISDSVNTRVSFLYYDTDPILNSDTDRVRGEAGKMMTGATHHRKSQW